MYIMLVHIVSILFAIQHVLVARTPCTTKDCLEVRMPLLSNNLKAPLIADLDVSSMNKQLKEYIDDSINYTFSHKIEDVVDSKQDLLHTSMLSHYERNLNETKTIYNKQMHDVITGIEQKQDGLNLQIQNYSLQLDNSKYMFEKGVQSSLKNVDQQLANLKLAMFSEYVRDLQNTKSDYEKKYAEFVSDLKSQFTDCSKGLREEFDMIKTKSENQYHEMIAWKDNMTEHRVGFTACSAHYTSKNRIKFIQVKTAYGLSKSPPYDDGNFIVERAGFYLVSVNILSKDTKTFYIRLNGQGISRTYSRHQSSTDNGQFTGSTTSFIKAKVNDTIYIDGSGGDISTGSCLTIVKL
ncbi:uncharacterized protein [Mytilus edulis]|uniref:uncharacterized protein n=1 Tax=Mytilus edulis TaxID=6550 RepID=UPI0039EFAFC2